MTEPGGPPVEPTVVVGYPALAATPPSASRAGLERLPAQVRTIRLLLVACLALLVLLVGGLGAALVGTLSQMDDLKQRVTALSAQLESAPAPAPAPAAAVQPAPSASASAEKKLTTAPVLAAGVTRPDGVDETGAVLIGDPNATDIVEVYIDYQCPFCQRWEGLVGGALIARAVKPGSGLLVKQYNLAFLGETSPDLSPAGASARAASASACVLDVDGSDVFVPFSKSLFATADPSEPPGQFPAKQLMTLATAAGASAAAMSCIKGESFVPFVSATTKAGFSRGVTGTPTVVLNGKALSDAFADPSLTALATGAAS
jgi:protein-disulfide isomerase